MRIIRESLKRKELLKDIFVVLLCAAMIIDFTGWLIFWNLPNNIAFLWTHAFLILLNLLCFIGLIIGIRRLLKRLSSFLQSYIKKQKNIIIRCLNTRIEQLISEEKDKGR